MVTCWTRSGGRTAGEGSDSAHFPAKAFWICLSTLLLLVAMAMGLTLALTRPGSTALQTVRLTAPDQTGVLLNQTAVLDPQNHLVTLFVTAAGNQTSTVLFDVRHGLICYQPADQQRCFLQTMERPDYDHVGSLLSGQQNQGDVQLSGNETQRRTQFLGVMAGDQVGVATLDEPLRTLCRDRTVHRTRRTDGESRNMPLLRPRQTAAGLLLH
ncbi:BRICHOS domain-containing protein 5 isoform X2 [Poeciliopsis prolifica]|uniref:BRICHOS domain-containing protein 5 isoform X2 n=1 Tax=Poeciliopsis prolifica TaxID=188132 RepID=UPI00241424D5|nr:BRICHOS domain-containing protein 5 isoform X2 [Poeciliopsis prolifica]